MLIVLDDVLDIQSRMAVVSYFSGSTEARAMKWEDGSVNKIDKDKSPMALLLNLAAKHFDLYSMVGSEYWAHYGTKPDWHIDKDEKLFQTSGKIEHPICSIVYYADIKMTGGNFMTETATVTPVTNRMIAFSPGLLHGVAPFTGTRLAVAVNPWSHKPMGYV